MLKVALLDRLENFIRFDLRVAKKNLNKFKNVSHILIENKKKTFKKLIS